MSPVVPPLVAQAPDDGSAETAGEARRRIQQMLLDELLAQRKAWQEHEKRVNLRPENLRQPAYYYQVAMGHCHDSLPHQIPKGASDYGRPPIFRPATLVHSRTTPIVAFCPVFELLNGRSSRPEASAVHDSPALKFTSSLVDQLERASVRFPNSRWFAEQAVRVMTENDQFDRALTVARSACDGNGTWCRLMQAYVLHSSGSVLSADSLIDAMLRDVTVSHELPWFSAQALLDSSGAASYRNVNINQRLLLDSTFWWLATPFLSDAGNARLTEHVARVVRNQLNIGLPFEAKHALRLERGADALLETRVRYGFPSHQLWVGENEDAAHFSAYLRRRYDPPYSAMEYSRDNAAVAPTWAQVLDPLSLTDSSVALSAPRDATVDTWWPHEFFLHPRGRIVHLPASQRVWLRRDDHAVLVAATTVAGGELDALPRAPVRVVLAHSAGPAAVTQRTTQTAQPGERVVLQQRISRPGLVGFEILADSGGLAGARSRVGVREVPTLAALGPGTCALTEPALLDGAVAVDPNAPFAGLLGSTTLDRPTRMGVAWESYGFAPSDTVSVAVRLASADALSALRRAGMALRVADDPRVSVTMQWQEPDPARAGTVVPGTRPIVSRAVMLDVRQLRRGSYVLEVEMQSARCGTVTSQRELTVQR